MKPFYQLALTAFLLFPILLNGAGLQTPLAKEEAHALLQPINKALGEWKKREEEKVALPAKVQDHVEALKKVKQQIEQYVQTEITPRGILTYFQDNELTKEDGKYLADLTTLCALYVENELRLYSKQVAEADANFLTEVKSKASLLGDAYTEEQFKELAAAIRMMETFHQQAQRHDKTKLSTPGLLLYDRCFFIVQILDDEWEDKAYLNLSKTKKYMRSRRCVEYIDPVFEAIQGKRELAPLP